MAAFAPTHVQIATGRRVEAHEIVDMSTSAVAVILPNREERVVEVPRRFFEQHPAIGHVLLRFEGAPGEGGHLAVCPAGPMFDGHYRPIDAIANTAARPMTHAPFVEEPRVPRRDGGLPNGRPHP